MRSIYHRVDDLDRRPNMLLFVWTVQVVLTAVAVVFVFTVIARGH